MQGIESSKCIDIGKGALNFGCCSESCIFMIIVCHLGHALEQKSVFEGSIKRGIALSSFVYNVEWDNYALP